MVPVESHHFLQIHKIASEHFCKSRALFNWPPELLDAELKQAEGFGLELNQKIVAFILSRKQSVDIEDITCLAVSAECEGMGLMSSLFSQWLLVMKSRQISEIWLDVHEKNLSAIRFYERKQFQKIGMRPKYYTDKCAAYLYTLYLTE